MSLRARQLYVNQGQSPVKGPSPVVSAHLGGSSSVTGIRDGVAIGNSMGLSPQSGLPHNNRVGDLDAMAIPYMIQKQGWTMEQVLHDLCSSGGLSGLSGASMTCAMCSQGQKRVMPMRSLPWIFWSPK